MGTICRRGKGPSASGKVFLRTALISLRWSSVWLRKSLEVGLEVLRDEIKLADSRPIESSYIFLLAVIAA
jgi:hypothetical protein